MSRKPFFLFLTFIIATNFLIAQTSISWNGYEIAYIGGTDFDTGLDGKDVNSKLQIKNVSNESPVPIYFQLYIEGLTAENPNRDNHGDGGFAVFPNGGGLYIEKTEIAYTQSWLSGIYESRFNNIPPSVNQSKSYNFHFLYSESQEALNASGFPKDASLVADLPVSLTFTNHENSIDVSNGDLSIEIEVTTDDTSPFYIEVATELKGFKNDLFNAIKVQDGNGGSTPYIFRAHVKKRNDWLVKIAKPGKKTEIISVDPNSPNINVTIGQYPSGLSPYNFTLIKSVTTPTGFWRGAVSESEGTFLAIPGQENWNGTSSPKTDSRIYKYSFDGTLLWDFDFKWEAWAGDMSEDGKVVVVASNHPEESGTYNPSGGEYMLVIDGETGNLIRNIPAIETKSLKISHDSKYVAIGTQAGTFHIYDLVNQQLHMNVGGLNFYGQVREILWGNDNSSIYVSTGDGYLRKYSLNLEGAMSSTTTWAAYAGGWSFVNGLNLTEDYNYITVGSKDKGQTVINTINGTILWAKHTGNFDSKVSKDGTQMLTFGGKVYDLLTGKFIGYLNRTATTHFFNKSNLILAVDRVNQGEQIQNAITVHSPEGDLLQNASGQDRFYDINDLSYSGGEQVQWSYLSKDDSRLIVLSRDMDTSDEVGISIFSITDDREDPLAVEDVPVFSDYIMLYPNPANDKLNLSFNNTFIDDIISVQILDINGRTIKNMESLLPHLQLDISELNTGVYLVKIQTLSGEYSTKLVKR
ncbi:MAG: T9SS type A sorting domain-containing protein [Bacteroidales bacterium]|nr:T9SS type A sorting domain-containing protein [Bacteroidales bacterium]